MKYDCLIIDDEQSIAQSVCEYFNIFDLTAAYETDYTSGLAFLQKHEVSLLLLDINLGEESGFILCKEIRKTSKIPIIFISARSSDDDILSALHIGGDDYITKPFTLSILLAKVNAILKRISYNAKPLQDSISFGNIEVDKNTQRVSKDGEILKLKPMEYKLLLYFIEHKNRALTKDELLNNIWNDMYIGEGTLSVHIRHLREKIENDPNNPIYIKTIWGTGYLFEVET